MRRKRPALFKGRQFEPAIIILCVRRYLRFSLSYRNIEELMAERNLSVDHVTIWRWESSARWRPTRSRSTAAAPACSTPTSAGRDDPWADERTGRVWIQGDLHCGELRHVHGRRRRADLRCQRLRRGLPRPLHLGRPAVRREPGPAGVGQGDLRRRHHPARAALRPRLPRPGPGLHRDRRRPDVRAAPRHDRGPGAAGAAAGEAAHPRRPARRAHRDRGLRPGAAGRARAAPARRRRARRSHRGVRGATWSPSPRASASGGSPTRSRTWPGGPGSASAAPVCPPTPCSSRGSTRRWTTTSCSR